MRFLDSAKIWVQSGAGGSGSAAFRREKFIEFGGPNGGDGGRGGHIIAVADPDLNTLIDFRYRQHFKARRGEGGMGQERTGKSGTDVVLRLPVGTQIVDEDGETVLVDVARAGQEVMLLKGGDGGRGNVHFKSSTNRAPRRADPGWPGEERWVWLKLKLLADAGLVGLPNAGKSTFLSTVSRARPKIADYQFTTLEPKLGTVVVEHDGFTIADLPGLIEGAHTGAGLGDQFLGHVERCAVLIHLVDGTEESPSSTWRTVRRELELYGRGVTDKPELVCLTKIDALTPAQLSARKRGLEKVTGREVFALSSVAQRGIEPVIHAAFDRVREARAERTAAAAA